jgi:hypothetical protein
VLGDVLERAGVAPPATDVFPAEPEVEQREIVGAK